MSKIHEAAERIAEGYEKLEGAVVGGYKMVEDTVVGSFTRVADRFVDAFLTRDGETPDQAKARLAEEQKIRQEQQKALIEESLEASRSAGKRN